MDPITLILTALATGAAAGMTAGAKDTVSSAIKDAYTALNSFIARKFAGKPEAEVALSQHKQDPDTWDKPLRKSLSEVQADRDPQIIEAARNLMNIAQTEGRVGGTSVVVIGDRGVGIGGDMSGGSIITGDTNKLPEEKV